MFAAAISVQTSQAATYQITEITPSDDFKQHFGKAIGDDGTVVGVMRDQFNFPIYPEEYLSTMTYNGISCSVSDEEIGTGNFDAFSTTCIRAALVDSASGNATYQKVASLKSFKSDANQALFYPLADVEDPELGTYTYSNFEQLVAINSDGIAVGTASAPYIPTMFQQTGDSAAIDPVKYWIREYSSRAVIDINGEKRTIEPEITQYGGETVATDISNFNTDLNVSFVSGQTSIEIFESAQDAIDANCNGELFPVDVCVWSLSSQGSIYKSRPVVWQIDPSGNIVSSKIFDIAFEPTEEQTGNYNAITSAVNSSGVAVGYGQIPRTDGFIVTQPLIYTDEGTNTFIDVDDYLSGYAVDINNSNVVIGHVQSSFSNNYKDKFFIYDMDSNSFETPTTFYETAESNANAINDNGIVVGEAEYEITNESVRRKHGFIYDSVSKEFFDINDLVDCGSEYDIYSLNDINNNNQIVASALKLVDVRDALGVVSTNSDGTVNQEQVSVTLLLDPINGEPENCSDIDDSGYERQGLSTTFGFISMLFGLMLGRRWYRIRAA